MIFTCKIHKKRYFKLFDSKGKFVGKYEGTFIYENYELYTKNILPGVNL